MQSGETIHEIVKGTNKENKELQKTELSLIYQASHQPDKEWPFTNTSNQVEKCVKVNSKLRDAALFS